MIIHDYCLSVFLGIDGNIVGLRGNSSRSVSCQARLFTSGYTYSKKE